MLWYVNYISIFKIEKNYNNNKGLKKKTATNKKQGRGHHRKCLHLGGPHSVLLSFSP